MEPNIQPTVPVLPTQDSISEPITINWGEIDDKLGNARTFTSAGNLGTMNTTPSNLVQNSFSTLEDRIEHLEKMVEKLLEETLPEYCI